jgi:large subunit ribosomal protein L22
MEFKASHRYAPMSARKMRLVVDMVRGLPVNDALEVLKTTHRRAGPMINKVIRSAVANAEQAKALGAADLFVKVAMINDGPLKQNRLRWRAGPMGRMRPIRRRSSHIEITLGVVEGAGQSRRRAKKAAAKGQESGNQGNAKQG